MAKLEKILESMDSFKINSEVALLENTDLTDLTRAQTRKEIHESFNFIKEELTKGGLLEETQQILAEAWTQAIMEDIEMPSVDDVKDFGNKVAGGAQGLGYGLAANTGRVVGAVDAGKLDYIDPKEVAGNIADNVKSGYQNGYQNVPVGMGTTYDIGKFVGATDTNAADVAKAAALGIGGTAIAAGVANKVRRATPKKLPAPQA